MEFIPVFSFMHNFVLKHTIHRENHKKERICASLHVDQLSDVRGSWSGARTPIEGGYHKKCIHTPGPGSLDDNKNTQSVVY